MTSPTQRTLELLRNQCYIPWIVEKYNAFSGRRTDLFHIIDILIVIPTGVIGVQSTGTDFSGHKKKLMIDEEFFTKHWLKGKGNELILIGWRKVAMKRGWKRKVYKPRLAKITLEKGNLHFQELQSTWLRNRNIPWNKKAG